MLPARIAARPLRLLTYSVLVMLYLITVGIGGVVGVLLWPAVVVHVLLSALLIVAARAPVAQRP